MNKQFIFLILILSAVTNSYTQTVSNNPFQLYWERYVIEFEQDFISKNKIKNIEAKTVKYKNGKVKNERNKYTLEFNEEYLPVRYTYYLDFGLRNGLRYNPFWRRKNEYPVYNIWEYPSL